MLATAFAALAATAALSGTPSLQLVAPTAVTRADQLRPQLAPYARAVWDVSAPRHQASPGTYLDVKVKNTQRVPVGYVVSCLPAWVVPPTIAQAGWKTSMGPELFHVLKPGETATLRLVLNATWVNGLPPGRWRDDVELFSTFDQTTLSVECNLEVRP